MINIIYNAVESIPSENHNFRKFGFSLASQCFKLHLHYRRFIHQFSKIAKPLLNLLKKEIDFKLTNEAQHAFEILRDKLCQEPILVFPNFELPFNLTTDALGSAVGKILSQDKIGYDQLVAYVSRVLSEVEEKWDSFNKEGLALVFSIKHF